MVTVLKHSAILQPGTCVHFTRATLTPARPKALHSHDFYELFWVQNGTVRHHLDGGMSRLTEGDVIMLRPGEAHGLQGKGEDSMVVALCLRPDVVDGLFARHPGLLPDTPILRAKRDIRALATLNQAALALENSPRDSLAVEAFLLPLLASLRDTTRPDNAPDWLADALTAANQPEVFRHGAAGLVRVAGRAHPHVSRTMRAVTGQSPSEYVNSVRMNYAARQLITDGDPVRDIAQAVGIPNMAHFHKLFRAHHAVTPLQYRRKYQRDVVQP